MYKLIDNQTKKEIIGLNVGPATLPQKGDQIRYDGILYQIVSRQLNISKHGQAETIDVLVDQIEPQPQLNLGKLTDDDVEWVINDIAELGVKIGNQFFFLYKGNSLVYPNGHDDGSPMKYRLVGKREFGETCHPVNLKSMLDFDRVSGNWKEMPMQKASE